MSDEAFKGDSEQTPDRGVLPPPKAPRTRRTKSNGATEPETTLERAESLPDEAQPAPEQPPLQEADDLDEMLSSAVAPDDEDIDLDEAELGQPDYSILTRRTSPPQMIPIRIFPKSVGAMTVYLLAVKREAQAEGDLDTYLVSQPVREKLAGHPVFQKAIRRFQIRLGVTSLGVPFFLEVNLDDHGIWGQSRRDLVAVAETKWLTVTSDRQAGYRHWDSDHFEDPAQPKQGFEELYKLTYRPCLITTLEHPVIKRGKLRKANKP
jgi:hypothetical protein